MLVGALIRDPNCQTASLQKKRQEIGIRIDHLQERIEGIVHFEHMQTRSNMPLKEWRGRLTDQQRPLKPVTRCSIINSNDRNGDDHNNRLQKQMRSPQDEINRLYELVISTLEGQNSIQNELRLLRQDMKQLNYKQRDRHQGNSPLIRKHGGLEMVKKESGSPADRLYSNDYHKNGTIKPTEVNSEMVKIPQQEVSTTPFWHHNSRANAETAHFNPQPSHQIEKENKSFHHYQPPTSKRQKNNQQRTSRLRMLNQSQGLIASTNNPKTRLNISSIAGPNRKKSTYVMNSVRKKSHRGRPNKPPTFQQLLPPKGILKNSQNDDVPVHPQQLHRVFQGEKHLSQLERTCSYSDYSRSRQKSTMRFQKITVTPEVRSVISQKIQRRLRESKDIYIDSHHKNVKHQHHHMTNTVDLQKKLRQDLLCRLHQMRDTKRYK